MIVSLIFEDWAMTTYRIEIEGEVLKIGFGTLAQNDEIVRDAAARLDEMIAAGELKGGPILKVNGPATNPVCYVLAHKVAHLYGAKPQAGDGRSRSGFLIPSWVNM
jgi:CRISPR-associated protein Csx3